MARDVNLAMFPIALGATSTPLTVQTHLYQMTVIDPGTFTEPVVLSKAWMWRANGAVRPFGCTVTN